jgi:hypothetical protein
MLCATWSWKIYFFPDCHFGSTKLYKKLYSDVFQVQTIPCPNDSIAFSDHFSWLSSIFQRKQNGHLCPVQVMSWFFICLMPFLANNFLQIAHVGSLCGLSNYLIADLLDLHRLLLAYWVNISRYIYNIDFFMVSRHYIYISEQVTLFIHFNILTSQCRCPLAILYETLFSWRSIILYLQYNSVMLLAQMLFSLFC